MNDSSIFSVKINNLYNIQHVANEIFDHGTCKMYR